MKCPIIARTRYGVEKGVGKGGYGLFILDCLFSGFSFSVCMIFNPPLKIKMADVIKTRLKASFVKKKDRIYVSNFWIVY